MNNNMLMNAKVKNLTKPDVEIQFEEDFDIDSIHEGFDTDSIFEEIDVDSFFQDQEFDIDSIFEEELKNAEEVFKHYEDEINKCLEEQYIDLSLRLPKKWRLSHSHKKGTTRNSAPWLIKRSYSLGSSPRVLNSLRIIRFIQPANDSSPSCCCAFSIASLNSGSKRNWKGGLPRLFLFMCVDTSIAHRVMYIRVMTHYTQMYKKTMPRSAGTHTRHLTTTLYEVTPWLLDSLPKLTLNFYGALSVARKIEYLSSLLLLTLNRKHAQYSYLYQWCLWLVFVRRWFMIDFIDRIPLTTDEVAFQSMALAYAAIHINQPAVSEALMFVLLEKLDAIYEQLTEVDIEPDGLNSDGQEVNHAAI